MTEVLLIAVVVGVIFLIARKDGDKDKDMAETKVTIRQVEGLETELDGKQATLVSGTNIKTLNSVSLLGSGDIVLSGVGETNTASNLGAGVGVFAQKDGVDLEFKGLVAGSGITLTPSATGITIASTASGSGEVNTGANLGTANGIYAFKSGDVLSFKSLRAGTNVTMSADSNEITINAVNVGETNTASNLGAGLGIYSSKVGVDIRLKSLVAGTGVTMSATADAITINAAGATNFWTDSTTYIYPNTASTDTRIYDAGGFYAKVPTQAGVISGYGTPSVTAYDNWSPINAQTLIKTKRLAANYTTTHADYRTLTWLSSHVVVHDSAAGYQQSFTSDSGGRTMTNAYEAMVVHRAKGDMNGFFATVSVLGHDSMGSISGSWTGQPSGVVIAGQAIANAAKTNLYGQEYQIDANGFGNITGIGSVVNLRRANLTADYNHLWLGYLAQGESATFSDIGFVARGNINVGFDTRGLAGQTAMAMAVGQRLYFGSTATTFATMASAALSGPYLVSNGTDITVAGGIIRQTGALGLVSPVTATSATAGVASALPAAPFTYIRIQLDGVNYKIPVYNN